MENITAFMKNSSPAEAEEARQRTSIYRKLGWYSLNEQGGDITDSINRDLLEPVEDSEDLLYEVSLAIRSILVSSMKTVNSAPLQIRRRLLEEEDEVFEALQQEESIVKYAGFIVRYCIFMIRLANLGHSNEGFVFPVTDQLRSALSDLYISSTKDSFFNLLSLAIREDAHDGRDSKASLIFFLRTFCKNADGQMLDPRKLSKRTNQIPYATVIYIIDSITDHI